jgi:hypothetical protein
LFDRSDKITSIKKKLFVIDLNRIVPVSKFVRKSKVPFLGIITTLKVIQNGIDLKTFILKSQELGF